MRFSTANLISGFTLLIGFFFDKPLLLLALSVFIASVIEILTRDWATSHRLGRAVVTSVILKLFFQLIGLYALIGQLVCIWLILKWFVM